MRRRRHSELECFTLGLVWQLGPSSPYEIRRHMQTSPSTQWSASAGAIYPMMTRLQKQGLLSAKAARNGERRRREYSITPAGLSVLRGWIGPPMSAEVITVAHDPLRSRARFLDALPPSQRQAWIHAAREALDEIERRVQAWQQEHAPIGPSAELLTASGKLDVSSRREWIDQVGAAASKPARTSAPPAKARPRKP